MLETLRHYWRLYRCIIRLSLLERAAFHGNSWLDFIAHAVINMTHLAVGGAIFANTPALGDWTPAHYLLFLGTFHIADGLSMVFCFFNILRLPELVRTGQLDTVLTRPVNAQWFVVFRQVNVASLFDLAYGLALVGVALGLMGARPGAHEVALYAVLTLNGSILLTTLNIMAMTATFWLMQNNSALTLLEAVLEFGLKPDVILPPWAWRVLTFFLPITVMFSFPARVVGGLLSPWLVLWALAAGALSVWASIALWRAGLRAYTGAGS